MTTSTRPILLFGATTASGSAFLDLTGERNLVVAGRNRPNAWPADRFLSIDLRECSLPRSEAIPVGATLVSFAPIWSLAPLVSALLNREESSDGQPALSAVVACSSSSVLTKRFAPNRQDRNLVKRLLDAEDSLAASCEKVGISCHILRPTLIYGQAGDYGDRNLSGLLTMMRRLPLLVIPSETGLRQPIHARQLAAAALHVVDRPEIEPTRLALGGDECISYETMLRRLQQAARELNARDPAARCPILPLPTILFHLLAAPLLPLSAKAFDAVLRMEADLAPFTPAHTLLGTKAEAFPVAPLAWGSSSPIATRAVR